jgi:hypothetical protein
MKEYPMKALIIRSSLLGTILFITTMLFSSAAFAGITSAVRGGGSIECAPVVVTAGLAEDAVSFCDRTHEYNSIPAALLGADFVQVSNDDKDTADYSLTVNVDVSGTLYLFIDNRITLPGTNMGWVASQGFTDTGDDIGIDESGDGDVDNTSSVFSKFVGPAPAEITLEQDEGSGTNMYGVAFVEDPQADLEITVVENSTPTIILPGSSDYTFTITNNGPDEATNVVATMGFALIGGPLNGSCTRTTSQGDTPNAGTSWAWSAGTIASGGAATLQEVCSIDATSQEANRAVTLTTTSLDQTDPVPGNNSATEDTDFVRSVTFDITKIWDGGEVDVTLTCSDGTVASTTTSGKTAQFIHTGFDDGVNCVVTETVPAGFAPGYSADCNVTGVLSGSVYSCDITNATTTARFHVTKDFSDGSTDNVDVTLTCDTGLPLEQSLTIAGGDSAGVTFVVLDYIDGTMSCSVTEATNTPGYDADTTGCVWENVMTSDSPFSCVINNTAQNATFTVYKDWEIFNEDEGGSEVFEQAWVTIYCDALIINDDAYYDDFSETWNLSDYLGDDESLTAVVSTLTGPANCWANESIDQSGVESTGDCGSRSIPAGGNSSCTFTNTVFFEGIPTLSQYGLALMALLMLGVGMVGFRRFA